MHLRSQPEATDSTKKQTSSNRTILYLNWLTRLYLLLCRFLRITAWWARPIQFLLSPLPDLFCRLSCHLYWQARASIKVPSQQEMQVFAHRFKQLSMAQDNGKSLRSVRLPGSV